MHWYLRINRLLGIFPFESGAFSIYWMVYSLVVHLCILITLHAVRIYAAVTEYDSTALRIGYYINGIMGSFIGITHLYQLWNNKRVVQVLAIINKHVSHPSAWKKSLITLIFHQLINFVSIFWKEKWYMKQGNIFPVSTELISFLIILQFITCINQLTQEIQNLTKREDIDVLSDPEAMEQSQWISDFFSPQIGLMCAKSFLQGLFFSFRIIKLYNTESFILQAAKVALIAVSFIYMVLVVRACANMDKSVSNTTIYTFLTFIPFPLKF